MKRDRKEISRLKREILQLRKLLHDREQQSADAAEIIEEDKEDRVKEIVREIRIRCPKCKADMETVDLGSRGIYTVCTNTGQCWHRSKLKR